MADAVVQFLIEKLSSLLQEESLLLSGVREEAEYMRAELESMTAFLRVADAKEDSDSDLKVWVNQVRDVTYDTDDLLDKFILRLAHHHHGNGIYGHLRRICCNVKNLKASHQIASEIQSLKSRVTQIAERHQRYCSQNNFPQQSSSSSHVIGGTAYDWRRIVLLQTENDIVGIDRPKHQLVKWLIEGDSAGLKCVSVVGIGGSGKTTLVQQVYNDAAVKQHFRSHLWLVVSESYNIDELLINIIEQLYGEDKTPAPHGLKTMKTMRLKALIDKFLEQRRYLIFIDDVWKTEDWDVVKQALPENNLGSRVLLTTRFVEIASKSQVDTNGHTFPLEPLSKEDSWALFCKKAFAKGSCPPLLEEISRTILRRCEGLPLAIVAIGGALATKDQSRIDEWETFHRSLPSELDTNGKLERINKLLSLSYYDMPHYLKICFLYMCIFPEDDEIERTRLVRLWIAEGFIQVREGMAVEEVADNYLYELVNRSLVQVSAKNLDGRLRTCRVHHLFREIILSKAREQRIVMVPSKSSTVWPENVRRIAIHEPVENLQVSTHKCFNRLRSLLILRNADSLPLSKLLPILTSCKLLKVLDLRDAPLDEVVPNEIFELVHLRYLSMRGTRVKTLPKLIGKLENLETLDLKHTQVTQLPDEILKLQQLRHLLVYSYDKSLYTPFHSVIECKTPSNIGGLVSLQKLCYIDVSNNMIVSEVGKLTQLRRLGITKLRREDGNDLCSSIAKLSNLRSLTVHSIEEDECINLESLSSSTPPPPLLRTLVLEGPLQMTPNWIQSLHNLVNVYLRWSKLRDDPLNFLQGLPNLRSLKLHEAYEGEGLRFKAGGFQRLKRLWLKSMKELRWVRVEENSMPELEQLSIANFELMHELPFGIQHLTNLQHLLLWNVPIADGLRGKGRDHGDFPKIAHIPTVVVGSTKHGRVDYEFM